MAVIAIRSAAPKSGFSFIPFVGALVTWNDRRITRKALTKLSARQLDDIGLSYSDIESIATGTFTH